MGERRLWRGPERADALDTLNAGILDLALAGLAWAFSLALAQPHIDAGSLVELASECPVMVSLFWTVSRLHAQALNVMTDAVRSSARRYLDVEPGFRRDPMMSFGGPRGCLHRSNTSMTIMRPPQQGHGGRKSSGSSGCRSRTGQRRQQFAGEREAGLAGAAGEQAVVADAMEAARQDMEQEAADELVGRRAS
jgi:hypothetical protein